MTKRASRIQNALLAGGVAMATWPAAAAEVTSQRLTHAYPNASVALATAGGLIFLALAHGIVAANDGTTLDKLWKNVRTGCSAPPTTFAVGSWQFLAITAGRCAPTRSKLVDSLPLKNQRNATALYV